MMFCPRCGQQAAEEVRYCSRCGLPLDAAAELVEAGGDPGRHPARADAGGGELTPRQRGTRKGLMIVAGGALFFVIVAILNTIKDDFFPVLLLAALVLTAGVMRMLYALLLEDNRPVRNASKRAAAADSPAELARARAAELPPARAVPASHFTSSAADTRDMAGSPLSVTEGTTRLLEEDEPGAGS